METLMEYIGIIGLVYWLGMVAYAIIRMTR